MPITAVDANGLKSNLEMTLRQWTERYQREIVFDRVHYRGVPSWKNVCDLWVIQEIIWETQVERVIEIGVQHGGTMLWLSDLMRNFRGDRGLIVSVDLKPPALEIPGNVRLVLGDSVAPETIERVKMLCANHRTMLIADGDHAADRVLEEMRRYGPLISEGCYFIAEDGIVDVMDWKTYTPGPMVAAHRFVAETDEFVIDRSREKFILTYVPDGFLKRVRPPAQSRKEPG